MLSAKSIRALGLSIALVLGLSSTVFAHGDKAQAGKGDETQPHMREMHKGHDHAHDFEAMERMSPEDMDKMMSVMADLGLAIPPMDSARGRKLFLEKGCVACHAVNGIGGDVGPTLDASNMPEPMNTFEFAARMWRGAPAMIAMQKAQFGEVIELNGRDLADIIAFAHDESEQRKLNKIQVPERYLEVIGQ
jgi:hypothetical protein